MRYNFRSKDQQRRRADRKWSAGEYASLALPAPGWVSTHVYRPLANEAGERRAVCLEVGGDVESPLPMNPASVIFPEWPRD